MVKLSHPVHEFIDTAQLVSSTDAVLLVASSRCGVEARETVALLKKISGI
jgi:hypothetical protein